MKCPECGGVGRIHYGEEWCSACNGTGEIVTNEEWIKSANTEQLADLMSRIVGCINCPIPKDGRNCIGTYNGCWYEIIKWLKQPHTEKE